MFYNIFFDRFFKRGIDESDESGKSEDGGRKTEDRRPKTEDRRPKPEVGSGMLVEVETRIHLHLLVCITKKSWLIGKA